MSAAALSPPLFRTRRTVPLLENGDHLTATQFLRRWEKMPDLKNAELIGGTSFVTLTVRVDHALPHGLILGWLGWYALDYPGLRLLPSVTLVLNKADVFQPDATLCSRPRPGGRVWLDAKGYLCGAPELVCEVAATSATIDLHAKFSAYERAGVQEYLVWLTMEKRVLWFALKDGKFVQKKERAGKLSSAVFPGLVLDVKALLKHDRRRVVAALRKS